LSGIARLRLARLDNYLTDRDKTRTAPHW